MDLLGIGWRPIFLINIPIGVIAFVLALRALPPQGETRERPRLDLPGAALLSLALLLVVTPLVFGPEQHWPLWSILCLTLVPLTIGAFIVVERRVVARGDPPLINVAVITRSTIAWALTANITAAAGYFALLFILAIHLQQGLGHTPLYSGLSLIPWVVAFGILAPPLARKIRKYTRHPIAAGYTLLTIAYIAITVETILGVHDGPLLFLTLGLGGLGLGTGFSSLLIHLTDAVDHDHAADISGLLNTTSQLAGTIGIATYGTLYLTTTETTQDSTAFTITSAAMTISALLATVCAYLTTRPLTNVIDKTTT